MTSAPEPRSPRVFEPDDPAIVAPPEHAEAAADPGAGPQAPPDAAPVARPTLGDIAQRGWRWGALFLSAVTGALVLGGVTWFWRIVSLALARDDWVGWTMFGLIAVAAFALLMIVLREVIGFSRLARLTRLRTEISAALQSRDVARERRATLRLAGLYARRPETHWALQRFREHARDVHDPGELIGLADRDLMAPIDTTARQLITRSAKRVATVTTLSPLVVIAVGYVLIENLSLLRALATLYGGRPGWLGVLRLSRLVVTHMLATGGIALTDDLLGQFLGQDILRRLSRRLGEGAFNGALTARVGVAAIEVIRPLPYLSAKPARVRDILSEALRPMFAGKGAP